MSPKTKQIYQMKVTLKDILPPIWRRILVSSDITLFELHFILQVAMGWENSHLHSFYIKGEIYGDPTDDEFEYLGTKDESKARLNKIVSAEGFRFTYEYDFGDSWEHSILVEKILPAEQGQHYPQCIKGKRACPPEDVGGTWGYETFLEALQDSNHSEHEEYLEWYGGEFNSEAFDLDETNQALSHVLSQLKDGDWRAGNLSLTTEEGLPVGIEALFNPDRWAGLLNQEANTLALELNIRKDAVALVTYLRDNKVTGTQSAGNLPRKAVADVAAIFANPPVLEQTTGEHSIRFRSEEDIWPVYWLHVILALGDLLSGGPGRRWRVTQYGKAFLDAPAAVQVWIIFTSWWFKTSWEMGFQYFISDDLFPEGFEDSVREILMENPAGKRIEFISFADRLIQKNDLQWPIGDQKMGRTILHDIIGKIVIEPLVEFNVLSAVNEVSTEYGTQPESPNSSAKALVAFQLTPFGLSLLKTVEPVPGIGPGKNAYSRL